MFTSETQIHHCRTHVGLSPSTSGQLWGSEVGEHCHLGHLFSFLNGILPTVKVGLPPQLTPRTPRDLLVPLQAQASWLHLVLVSSAPLLRSFVSSAVFLISTDSRGRILLSYDQNMLEIGTIG